MEGLIDFIMSVNKISLIAFIGVFGFLLYEVNLLRIERMKKQKPNIPKFNNSTVIDKAQLQQQAASLAQPKKQVIEKQNKPSIFLVIILVCMIIFFIGFSLYTVFFGPKESSDTKTPENVVIQEISSPGLMVFSSDWKEIQEVSSTSPLTPGTRVYLGILTIKEADIDRARIKVNASEWTITDITDKFNPEKNVFYREYMIATGDSQLKIDAQLHSAMDGWLGD